MIARSQILSALVCGALLLGTGCQSLTSRKQANDRPTVFDYDGIPVRGYYIGGGNAVRYIAKNDGTLFMSDDTARRLLETICLRAGEKYETKHDIGDEKAVIKLYFVPATDI